LAKCEWSTEYDLFQLRLSTERTPVPKVTDRIVLVVAEEAIVVVVWEGVHGAEVSAGTAKIAGHFDFHCSNQAAMNFEIFISAEIDHRSIFSFEPLRNLASFFA
jgi:hypothetical protein